VNERGARRLPWFVWGCDVLVGSVALALWVTRHDHPDPVLNVVAFAGVVGYASVGALIASKHPDNAIGWLLCFIAAALAMGGFADSYVGHGLRAAGALPGARWAAWLSGVTFPLIIAPIPLMLLLFPDGRVPSRRWRSVAVAMVAAPLLGVLGFALKPGLVGGGNGQVPNPTGVESLKGLVGVLLTVSGVGSVLAGLACAVALVVRYRRSRGEERQQVRWLAYVGGTAAIWSIGSMVAGETVWNEVFFVGFVAIVAIGIPTACVVAILRFHLYDMDVVINKTVVYGALAAFITAVYIGIVVGIGSAIGHGTSKPNLGLSILATAVVAVAFQYVRVRVQRFANRLVYGKRSTPYEVLSAFSDRVSGTLPAEELLPRMARTLADGTGAVRTTVWLAGPGDFRVAARWPEPDGPTPVPVARFDQDALPELEDSTLTLPVRHSGDLLGAITLTKPATESLRPAEEQLARDLASQAGLVLHNVRLGEELRARLEELRASRRRLVAAQDAARRRLERNIHDGAQQQLVALSVKTNLARQLVAAQPEKAEELVRGLRTDVGRALEDLAELARGVVPAALTELGLAEALRVQAGRAALPVTVEAPPNLPRVAEAAEAAAYFCVLEALQNVAKYARATRAAVALRANGGELRFTVRDDGVGFDPAARSMGTGMQGMADRLGTLGGTLEVHSEPGHGTTVEGRLPVRALQPAT